MNNSLSQLHTLLLDKGIAFASHSLPGEINPTTIVSFQPESFNHLGDFGGDKEEGFVFAPFVISDDNPLWFFNADYKIDEFSDIDKILEQLNKLPDFAGREYNIITSTSKNDYSKSFDAYLSALNSGRIDKAILSKIISKDRSKESVFSVFNRLLETYPLAFTYLIHLPSGEMWMGATPELLVDQDEAGIKTMALAGTQKLDKRNLNDVVWEKKEIEEQAYVRDYVFKILETVSDNVEVSETHSAKAGNLVHLRTDFYIKQMIDGVSSFDLAKKLHPTPAVCGISLEKSRALILKEEQNNRAYYTGFLGPIKSNSLSLFVNLRCMQVLQKQYVLYVGGGITRDSEMEKEWTETESKAQTLLSIIDFSSKN